MAVYALFELRFVDDPTPQAVAAYEHYREVVADLVARHGGTYLVRAGRGTALEGAPAGDRFHLLEFPDGDAARAFWASPEYVALKPGRDGAVSVRAILLEPG